MRKFYQILIPIIIFSAFISISIPAYIEFTKSNFTKVWIYNSENYIVEIDVSTDYKYLIAGTEEGLLFFDILKEDLLWNNPIGRVSSVSMSNDGNHFVAGLFFGYVYYFERTNITPLWKFRTPTLGPFVSISSDGESIASIYNSYTMVVFDSSSSTPLWNATTQNQSQINSLLISSDGKYIIQGDFAGKVYFFNNTSVQSRRSLWNFTTGDAVNAVSISSNNSYVAAGSNDNTVYVFNKSNSTSKSPLWTYTTQGDIKTIDFTYNEEYLVVSSTDDKIYLFDADNSNLNWTYLTSADISSVAISNDNKYIIAGDIEGNIYLIEITSGRLVSSFKTRGESYSIKISSEGNYIACASHYAGLSSSEFGLYLFDRSDPSYGKDFFYFISLLLQNIVIYGLPTMAISLSSAFLIKFVLWKFALRQERIEKEKLLKKLDKEFDDWEYKDKIKKN